MLFESFFHGVFLAFGLIVPLGAQNIFIFNQGASQPHFRKALPSILTAFFCDTLLIVLAVLGVSLIVLQLHWLKTSVLTVGFCFLLYMGWVTWRSAPSKFDQKQKIFSAKKQILFALSVSLLNPHAIIDTIGVIGANSLHYPLHARWSYMLGCIVVSFVWFFGLATAGAQLHKVDSNGFWMKAVNKLSALIIWGVAIYIGWQLIFD